MPLLNVVRLRGCSAAAVLASDWVVASVFVFEVGPMSGRFGWVPEVQAVATAAARNGYALSRIKS